MKIINSEEKIILAIDGLDIYQAKLLLDRCPNIKWVKVGLELFTRNGPSVIKILKDLNKKIFLDLKVRLNKNWRSNDLELKKFGYNQK